MSVEDVDARPRILFFGTFDERLHPRVQVLREGLAESHAHLSCINHPLGLSTSWKVRIAARPVLAPLALALLAFRWLQLLWSSVGASPDVVVVGYLGHFDVHLARMRFRRQIIVLDHLTGLAETVQDRNLASGPKYKLMLQLDKWALRQADLVLTDTREQSDSLPAVPKRTIVLPVGASNAWHVAGSKPRELVGPLRVVFFGLFTPLHGATIIAEAIANASHRCDAHFALVGSGQDHAEVQALLGGNANVEWHPWIDSSELPSYVAGFDVSLGIFGTTPKAQRVVPNKVYQGLAAGTVVVTSDTTPQRLFASTMPGDRIRLVPPGNVAALADEVVNLSNGVADLRARSIVDRAGPAAPSKLGTALLGALR